MTNASLIRFSRFAFGDMFGNKIPNIEFAMPGMYEYCKPYPIGNKFQRSDDSFRVGREIITLKRWRIKRKNYRHDFVWGYGSITNSLIVMKE